MLNLTAFAACYVLSNGIGHKDHLIAYTEYRLTCADLKKERELSESFIKALDKSEWFTVKQGQKEIFTFQVCYINMVMEARKCK